MTDTEVIQDFGAVLEKLKRGLEVLVERNHQPIAIIKRPEFHGRPIDECIASAQASGSHAMLDDEFAEDLEAVINSHRESLHPPSWD